jgi:hypothetical protein
MQRDYTVPRVSQCLSLRPNWFPPPPPPPSECVPPRNQKGGQHSLRVRVQGEPIRTTGEKACHSVYSVGWNWKHVQMADWRTIKKSFFQMKGWFCHHLSYLVSWLKLNQYSFVVSILVYSQNKRKHCLHQLRNKTNLKQKRGEWQCTYCRYISFQNRTTCTWSWKSIILNLIIRQTARDFVPLLWYTNTCTIYTLYRYNTFSDPATPLCSVFNLLVCESVKNYLLHKGIAS